MSSAILGALFILRVSEAVSALSWEKHSNTALLMGKQRGKNPKTSVQS